MVEKSWKRRAKARGEMHSLRRLQVSCSPSSATGESGAVASFGQIGEIDTLRQSAKSAKGDEEREDQELQSADFAEVELRRVTELWGEGDVLISPLPCSLLFLFYISLPHQPFTSLHHINAGRRDQRCRLASPAHAPGLCEMVQPACGAGLPHRYGVLPLSRVSLVPSLLPLSGLRSTGPFHFELIRIRDALDSMYNALS